VLEASDNLMPIGEAHCFRWDDAGLAVWRLTIGGVEIAGEWIIVDGMFVPEHEHGRQPRG
jgi:hypothetical protein